MEQITAMSSEQPTYVVCMQTKCKTVHELETELHEIPFQEMCPSLTTELDADTVDSITELWTTHARNIDTPNFGQWMNIFS